MKNGTVVAVNQMMVNLFLIKCNNGYILVDTGQPNGQNKIGKLLNNKKINPKDIKLIIITHAHQDHTANVVYFKKISGAKILIHEAEKEAFEKGSNSPTVPYNLLGKFFSKIIKEAKIDVTKADIIINNEFSLEEYGIKGKIIPTPGHTKGSLSVIVNDIIIVGDLIMGGFIKAKQAGIPFILTNKDNIIKSLKKLISYNPQTIYAGHGGPFTKEQIKKLIKDEQKIS